MTRSTISDILTVIFALVDDCYPAEGLKLLRGKPGRKPKFMDREGMTLMLAQDYLPYPGKIRYIEFLHANGLDLFPKRVGPSRFDRRSRPLRPSVEQPFEGACTF